MSTATSASQMYTETPAMKLRVYHIDRLCCSGVEELLANTLAKFVQVNATTFADFVLSQVQYRRLATLL